MGYGAHKHIDLVLRTTPKGEHAVVVVKEATAQFFGWTDHFKTQAQVLAEEVASGARQAVYFTGGPGHSRPGVALRIGRGTDPTRNEAGLTHTFRITSRVSQADLAELAYFTQGDWHWMERRCRKRMSRDWWLQRYAAIP